jgi:gliding motility-associated protein GldC
LVFVIKESIKEQLIKSHKISGEKIIVIYPAPGKNYVPMDINRKEHAKEEYSEGKEFFLYNSSFNNQEDLIELLKSFSQLKKRQQSNFKLLLLMELDPFIEKTLSAYKYRNDVKFIGVKDKNIKTEITAAAYAAILSFNTNEDIIAALNAMKSGVPVITTKGSAVTEVAEDAVLYADKEIKDIGEKMMQLYTNENLRSERIEKGIEKVKGLPAKKWQNLYRNLSYKLINDLVYFCRHLQFYKMKTSTISINVQLNDEKVPEAILWNASDSTIENAQKAKAMMLAFWDGAEKTALRIDLWTKEMMIDEMTDFFYQTLMTMADTYNRATQHAELVESMKKFAHEFYHKSKEKQMQENKA